jgi:hypothetical protein
MGFLKRLAVVELLAQFALAGCAILFGLIFTLSASLSSEGISVADAISASAALAIVVYLSGVVAVAFVGAPIYAILESRRRISILAAIAVGSLPASCFYLYRGGLSRR